MIYLWAEMDYRRTNYFRDSLSKKDQLPAFSKQRGRWPLHEWRDILHYKNTIRFHFWLFLLCEPQVLAISIAHTLSAYIFCPEQILRLCDSLVGLPSFNHCKNSIAFSILNRNIAFRVESYFFQSKQSSNNPAIKFIVILLQSSIILLPFRSINIVVSLTTATLSTSVTAFWSFQ